METKEKATWKVLNPQQEEFLKNFLDPQSETFSNYTQSALKAGYSEDYANSITAQMPKWLDEALEDNNLVRKALDNLYEFLGDRENINIRADMTKFTLSRLNKGKFSDRTEHTGKNGKDLPTPILQLDVLSNDSNEENSETQEED